MGFQVSAVIVGHSDKAMLGDRLHLYQPFYMISQMAFAEENKARVAREVKNSLAKCLKVLC